MKVISVSERLAGFQCMLNPRLGFFRRQQFHEGNTLQFQEPVFIDQAAGGQIAAAHHMRDFISDLVS